MILPFNDNYFMRIALEEAKVALTKDEVPVGAIIVSKQKIIAKGHNLTEQLCDVTAHAEIQAITAASNTLNSKYLKNCTLYVTLEPCVMCSGAIFLSQIPNVVFGVKDKKNGFFSTSNYKKNISIKSGVIRGECYEIISSFFKNKRNLKRLSREN